jgi:hypothetical protein
MPYFDRENCEIDWERQLRKILPYTLDNAMHSAHWGQEWSIKDECDRWESTMFIIMIPLNREIAKFLDL